MAQDVTYSAPERTAEGTNDRRLTENVRRGTPSGPPGGGGGTALTTFAGDPVTTFAGDAINFF